VGFIARGNALRSDDMKEILLTQGMVTLVEDEDFEWLNQWRWTAHKSRNTYYAHRSETIGGKKRTVIMHRILLDLPEGYLPDHIDGNGLNNQRSNLRAVTIRQNNQNNHRVKTSQYPGVRWHKKNKNWLAAIRYDGKFRHLGCFTEEIDAFRAYYDFILSIGETILDFPYPIKQEQGALL